MPDTHDRSMHRGDDDGIFNADDVPVTPNLASYSAQTTVEAALEELYRMVIALGGVPTRYYLAATGMGHDSQQDRALDQQTYQPDAQQGAGTQLLP